MEMIADDVSEDEAKDGDQRSGLLVWRFQSEPPAQPAEVEKGAHK